VRAGSQENTPRKRQTQDEAEEDQSASVWSILQRREDVRGFWGDETRFADFEKPRQGLRILRRRDEVCGFWGDETRFADFEKTRRGLGVFRRRGFSGTNSVSATRLLLQVRQIFVCPDELWLVTMAARKSRRILWICFRAWLRDEISVPMQTNSYYCDAIVVMRCSYLSLVPSIPKAVSLSCKSLLLTISDWGSCKRMRPAAVGDHR
jgi:hypothetical protein